MTSTAMNTTYINALLADASYVDLTSDINANLKARLTEPLANFITTNFEVLNQQPDSFFDGFSATVWKGKAGADYAGQILSLCAAQSLALILLTMAYLH